MRNTEPAIAIFLMIFGAVLSIPFASAPRPLVTASTPPQSITAVSHSVPFFQDKDQQAKDSPRIKSILKLVQSAQDHYKDKKFDLCTESINKAIGEIQDVAKAAKKTETKELMRQVRRVRKAISLLKKKGQSPKRFPAIKIVLEKSAKPKPAETKEPSAMMEPNKMKTEKISFSQKVAPILARRCGNCHINRASGGVRFQRFAQLENLIEIGDAESSQLFDVIDSGQMPPGNNKVPDSEKAIIEKWINEGAKFDGNNVRDNINTTAENGVVSSLSSEDLTKQRRTEAEKSWKLALPGQKYSTQETESLQFLFSKSIDPTKSASFSEKVESQFQAAKKKIGTAGKDNQFAKAKPTILVIGNYYDFTEYNRIIIRRPSNPRQRVIDGNIASGPFLVFSQIPPDDWQDEHLQAAISALAVGSLQSNTPSWFKNSIGQTLLTKTKSKKNRSVPTPVQAGDVSGTRLESWRKGTLVGPGKSKINRVVGLGWTAYGKQKNKLLKKIASGTPFPEAFQSIMKTSPSDAIKKLSQIGLQKQKRK